jgi:spermidine synthase
MRPSASTQASSRSAIVGASLLVFACSAFIMTLEIVAARLVAQHLGVSLYTWTAVIGVVLAGIALGNYVGGKLADLYAPRALLTTLFLFASISSLSVLFIVDWMGSWERPEFISWPFWILRNVALTFFAPAAIMGTISPVAAKLALTARSEVGATVGTLYASGAAGSILGTFLTGYVLIDAFGTKTIVCVIAAGLGLLGLLVGRKLPRSPASFFVAWLSFLFVISSLSVAPWAWSERWGHFFGLRFATDHLHYQDESSYFAIEIYDAEEFENTRVLALDHLVHSYVNMDDITQLEYGYETVYAAVTHHLIDTDRPLSTLFIGGGGFTFPRYLETRFAAATIDVAEIDPAVKRAAQAALGLPADNATRIRTHTMDARNYIADLQRQNRRGTQPHRFDFVYGDAFNDLGVPYHLTTQGFNERLAEVMTPDAVYMINIIDIYREGLGQFLGSYVSTVRQTFPFVYVFAGDPDGPTDERDTFIVVSSRRALPILDIESKENVPDAWGRVFAWAEAEHLGGDMATVLRRSGGLVLTDDHAPVDNLLAPLFTDGK